MSFIAYIRSILGEFVLLAVCVWALETLVMDGFYVVEDLQFGPVPAAVSAVLLAACYLASYKQRFLLVGGIGIGILVVGIVAVAFTMSTGSDAYADEFGNWFWAAIVIIVVTLGGFLLTRTLVGSGVWFVISVFASALVQMLFQTGRLPLSLAVLLTSLALLVFRNFRIGQASVDSATSTSNLANFAFSTIPIAALIGIACVIWFAIIAPLQPGIIDAHLITEYRKENIEQVRGVGTVQMEVDTSMTSDQLVEGERYTTDDLKIDPEADKAVEAKAAQAAGSASHSAQSDESGGAGASGESAGERDALERDSLEQQFDPSSYTEHIPPLQALLAALSIILFAAIAYFLLRRYGRRRRLERFLSRSSKRDQIGDIYLFLMDKLTYLGFTLPPGSTLNDFSKSTQLRMETMSGETHVPFSLLIESYEKTAYAAHEPSEDEVIPFVTYYLHFWKAARRQLGNIRYFFKSFRLG